MRNAAHRRPRVLVIAYGFPPHAAIGTMRTLRVVRRLVEENWDVTVLTSDPRTFRPGTPEDPALMSRVPPGVRIVRAGTMRGFDALKGWVKGDRQKTQRAPGSLTGPAASRRSQAHRLIHKAIDLVDAGLAIPDHESGWLIPAVVRGLAATRSCPPDVLYSSAPPWTGQLVARALASLGYPWVADFRDPWSRAPWRSDRFRFAMKAASVLERTVVARADNVLFVAGGNRDEFADHYGATVASKFRLVPNGCDPEEFDGLQRPPVEPDAPFVLLHAGSLYAGRTPMPLLNAIAFAVREGGIDPRRFRVRFLGTAALQDNLSAAVRELGLEQIVEFLPQVPREQSLRAMMTASALLLLQPGHTVSVPGKLYEYMATGRPILAIAEEGETADLVRGSGIGVSVTPSSETAIVNAVTTVMQMAADEPRRPSRELFDGTLRAAHIVDILAAVVRGEKVPAAGVSMTRGDWAATKMEKRGL